MGNFFRGLLFGIGIALLIAPKRGQEQRRLLSERFQKLRGYLSDRVQSNPALQQGADRITQTANTVKDAAVQATTQAKETVQNTTAQATTQAKAAVQNVTQQAAQAKETVQNTTRQAATQVKGTVQSATQQATQTISTRKNAGEDTLAATGLSATRMEQGIQSPLSSATASAQNGTQADTGLNTPISKIPGMEPEPQSELEAQGIHTTGQLLEQTATKEMRTEIAQKIGISAHMLRTLIDRADLMRLPGVGSEMATLLEEAGVNGCKDLQRRNPEHLYATLTGMQESSKSASLTPSLDELTQWIAEATATTNATHK